MQKVNMKEVVFSLKLIYKNMIWNRPRGALFGLIALALLLTGQLYFEGMKILSPYGSIGRILAATLGFSALALWFFGLPAIIFVIDSKSSPKRMQRLIETIPQYYDSSI
jgi:hypothetical protein